MKTFARIGEYAGKLNDAVGYDPLESLVSRLTDYINNLGDKYEPDVKEFMKGCYFDNGRLIRRGT
jgi:hypothetical protein